MTDWPAVCRAAGEAVARVLDEYPTRREREPVVGIGMGGDETVALDAAAEAAVVAVLEGIAAEAGPFTLVSEELGEQAFGGGEGGPWVIVDPIDGSLNAKRGIPLFALSIAVAEGPRMGDVWFAYVRDYGADEEWTARRGEGACLNARPLAGPGPKEEVEILVLEATRTDLLADRAAAMVGFAHRTRVFGSLALSLCHLAAGRVDAVCSLKPARSVDIAAAQLLVRERGLVIELPDDTPFEDACLDVVARSRVVAAGSEAACAELWERLAETRSDNAA